MPSARAKTIFGAVRDTLHCCEGVGHLNAQEKVVSLTDAEK